jgi:hypothetical protein
MFRKSDVRRDKMLREFEYRSRLFKGNKRRKPLGRAKEYEVVNYRSKISRHNARVIKRDIESSMKKYRKKYANTSHQNKKKRGGLHRYYSNGNLHVVTSM